MELEEGAISKDTLDLEEIIAQEDAVCFLVTICLTFIRLIYILLENNLM